MDAARTSTEAGPGPFAVRLTADALDAAALAVVAGASAVLPSGARILVTADGSGVPGLIAPGGAAPAVIRDLEVLASVGGALAADETLLAAVELDALRWPVSGRDHHGDQPETALAARGIARDDLDGVLLVRATRSSATGTVQRRPLWWADRIHSTATVALSWVLIDPADSVVLAAGTAVGHEERFGDVGAAIDAEPGGSSWARLPRRRETDAVAAEQREAAVVQGGHSPPGAGAAVEAHSASTLSGARAVSPPPPVVPAVPIDSD